MQIPNLGKHSMIIIFYHIRILLLPKYLPLALLKRRLLSYLNALKRIHSSDHGFY